ncbi:MAG: transposase [Pseudomonadota bacterium]
MRCSTQAREAFQDVTFPKAVWQKKWVVSCKPVIQRPEQVSNTWDAASIRLRAITNNCILPVADDKVTFRYKDSQAGRSASGG